MSRIYDNSWFRTALLLGAMGAGLTFTQLVPSYEEIAAAREQSAPSESRAQARPRHATGGVTGIDVNELRLNAARSTS